MKRTLVISAVILLLAIASICASAQTGARTPAAVPPKPAVPQPIPSANVPDSKIAVVDTGAFADQKAGITRYLNAVKSVQILFQSRTKELGDLQNRIQAISDDLTKLSGNSVVAQETIQAKQQEGEGLQRDFKYKKEQLDADFEKKFNEIVGPVSADIGRGLDQYARVHGLTMILDISKLLPAVLSVNPAMDVTQAFIAEYNSKNP